MAFRFAQIFLLGIAFASFHAFGYEIRFGEGAQVPEAEFILVPNGLGRLTLKYSAMPLIDLDASPTGGGRAWATRDGTVKATAADDGTVTVRHRDFLEAGAATLVFSNGRLASFSREGDEGQYRKDLQALCSRPSAPPTLPQLWREKSEERKAAKRTRWWNDSRLRLGYFNPNAAGTLFAELAALFAALAVVLRRRGVRIACAVAAALMLAGLFLSGSRGSFIAWAAGMAAVAVCSAGRRLARPKTLLAVAAAAVLGLGALLAAGSAVNGRFGANLLSVDAGNMQRLRCWTAAPEMAAAAPGGWGAEPGRSYCDWFQATDDGHRLVYLVNSHLTWMVQYGRGFRCFYVASWLLLFALLLLFARERAVRVALGVWTAFAVAMWFSTVGIFPTLWIVPALGGVGALASIAVAWRSGGVRAGRALAILGAAALVGCAAPFAAEAVGRRQSAARPVPVTFDGRVVRLGRGEVRAAILQDATVLSGDSIGRFGHDLRAWIERNPDAGAVLVADDPADLPPTVERLVAAGKGASRYLRHCSEHAADNGFCQAQKLVLLSPPFPPAAVPFEFFRKMSAKIVIGEFAARLDQGYSRKLPWATVVPGCELYIPGWPDMALSQ